MYYFFGQNKNYLDQKYYQASILAKCCISIPPESIRKQKLSCFNGVKKHIIVLKWVKEDKTDDYMFKVNNRNNRTRCETCSKLTIKTPE